MTEQRVVQAVAMIEAPAEQIFTLITDPSRQPEWDGNNNLARAESQQPVTAAGEAFTMVLTDGQVRENHVVEFLENRLIAWKPSPVGEPQPGHLWRWELVAKDSRRTEVTHTYDWTELEDPQRLERARGITAVQLKKSLSRLKQLAETNT